MPKEYKIEKVNELAETLDRSKIAILTDFRGIKANAMTKLRRALREVGVEYRVVKNTITAFATEKVKKETIKPLLEGPTAIVFGYDDEVVPARTLAERVKADGLTLRIKGAIMGDRFLDAQEVSRLSTIPPREILFAEFTGRLKAPVAGLMFALNSPLSGLVGMLHARINKMEGVDGA